VETEEIQTESITDLLKKDLKGLLSSEKINLKDHQYLKEGRPAVLEALKIKEEHQLNVTSYYYRETSIDTTAIRMTALSHYNFIL